MFNLRLIEVEVDGNRPFQMYRTDDASFFQAWNGLWDQSEQSHTTRQPIMAYLGHHLIL